MTTQLSIIDTYLSGTEEYLALHHNNVDIAHLSYQDGLQCFNGFHINLSSFSNDTNYMNPTNVITTDNNNVVLTRTSTTVKVDLSSNLIANNMSATNFTGGSCHVQDFQTVMGRIVDASINTIHNINLETRQIYVDTSGGELTYGSNKVLQASSNLDTDEMVHQVTNLSEFAVQLGFNYLPSAADAFNPIYVNSIILNYQVTNGVAPSIIEMLLREPWSWLEVVIYASNSTLPPITTTSKQRIQQVSTNGYRILLYVDTFPVSVQTLNPTPSQQYLHTFNNASANQMIQGITVKRYNRRPLITSKYLDVSNASVDTLTCVTLKPDTVYLNFKNVIEKRFTQKSMFMDTRGLDIYFYFDSTQFPPFNYSIRIPYNGLNPSKEAAYILSHEGQGYTYDLTLYDAATLTALPTIRTTDLFSYSNTPAEDNFMVIECQPFPQYWLDIQAIYGNAFVKRFAGILVDSLSILQTVLTFDKGSINDISANLLTSSKARVETIYTNDVETVNAHVNLAYIKTNVVDTTYGTFAKFTDASINSLIVKKLDVKNDISSAYSPVPLLWTNLTNIQVDCANGLNGIYEMSFNHNKVNESYSNYIAFTYYTSIGHPIVDFFKRQLHSCTVSVIDETVGTTPAITCTGKSATVTTSEYFTTIRAEVITFPPYWLSSVTPNTPTVRTIEEATLRVVGQALTTYIDANSINGDDISGNTIKSKNLNSTNVTSSNITSSNITSSAINTTTLVSSSISTGGVTSSTINATNITSSNIDVSNLSISTGNLPNYKNSFQVHGTDVIIAGSLQRLDKQQAWAGPWISVTVKPSTKVIEIKYNSAASHTTFKNFLSTYDLLECNEQNTTNPRILCTPDYTETTASNVTTLTLKILELPTFYTQIDSSFQPGNGIDIIPRYFASKIQANEGKFDNLYLQGNDLSQLLGDLPAPLPGDTKIANYLGSGVTIQDETVRRRLLVYNGDTQDYEDALNTKSDIGHSHSIANVTGLQTALDGKASSTHTHSEYAPISHTHTEYASSTHTHSEYAPISHTHTEYAPTSHTHTIANVTGLQTALDSKASTTHTHSEYASITHTHTEYAPTSHTHTIANVTGLQTALDGKASSTHVHSYNELTDKPTIPAAQIQSDWNQTLTTALDFIKNKPSMPDTTTLNNKTQNLTTSGTLPWTSIISTPTIPAAQIQSDWNQTLTTALDFIKNKPSMPDTTTLNNKTQNLTTSGTLPWTSITSAPTIPAAQIQSDWNQTLTTALDFIKNKPSMPDTTTLNNKTQNLTTSGTLPWTSITSAPTIPAAQIQSDWNQTLTTALDFIKNKPSIPDTTTLNNKTQNLTTSGTLPWTSITSAPTIPAAQIQSDWNQVTTTALDFIKNKPTIPAAQIQSDWNQTTTTALDFIKNKPTNFQTNHFNTQATAPSGVVGDVYYNSTSKKTFTHDGTSWVEVGTNATWSTITGTQSSVTLSGFGGTLDNTRVSGLDTLLSGKAAVSHTHTTANITGLDAALAGKAAVSHTHTYASLDFASATEPTTLFDGQVYYSLIDNYLKVWNTNLSLARALKYEDAMLYSYNAADITTYYALGGNFNNNGWGELQVEFDIFSGGTTLVQYSIFYINQSIKTYLESKGQTVDVRAWTAELVRFNEHGEVTLKQSHIQDFAVIFGQSNTIGKSKTSATRLRFSPYMISTMTTVFAGTRIANQDNARIILVRHNQQLPFNTSFFTSTSGTKWKAYPKTHEQSLPAITGGTSTQSIRTTSIGVSLSEGRTTTNVLGFVSGAQTARISNGVLSTTTATVTRSYTGTSTSLTVNQGAEVIQIINADGTQSYVPVFGNNANSYSAFERQLLSLVNDFYSSTGSYTLRIIDVTKKTTFIPTTATEGVMTYLYWINAPQKGAVQYNTVSTLPKYLFSIDGTTPTARSAQCYFLDNTTWVVTLPPTPAIGFKSISITNVDSVQIMPYSYPTAIRSVWGDYDLATYTFTSPGLIFDYFGGSAYTSKMFYLFQCCFAWIKYGHVALADITNTFMTKPGTDGDATTTNSLHKWWQTNVYGFKTNVNNLVTVLNTRADGGIVVGGVRYNEKFWLNANNNFAYITTTEFDKLKTQIF
jgi:hypothetical protein